MGKNIKNKSDEMAITSFMPDYPDIVPSHPDWTEEDHKRHIQACREFVKDLKEWPRI